MEQITRDFRCIFYCFVDFLTLNTVTQLYFKKPRYTFRTQRQKFYTDDANQASCANQCLLNKSGSHGVPNVNLLNFRFLLIDFGKMLCSPANELWQNSNVCSKEDYIPQILTVLLEIHRVYI